MGTEVPTHVVADFRPDPHVDIERFADLYLDAALEMKRSLNL